MITRLRFLSLLFAATVFLTTIYCRRATASGTPLAVSATVSCAASGKPTYITGTNCLAGGGTQLTIISDNLTINGEQVASNTFSTPLVGGDTISVTFDSSHFPDGSVITVEYSATDPFLGIHTATAQATVYNKAFVDGNQLAPDGVGSLSQGLAATTAIANLIPNPDFTLSPGAGQCLFQTKPAILTALPNNTVLYTWTHGTSNFFGDSRFDPNQPNQGVNSILTQDITTAMSPPGQTVVGYNFVFLDSCNSSSDVVLSGAFGTGGIVPQATDKAFLGYAGTEADTAANVQWSKSLMQELVAGYTLQAALNTLVQNMQFPRDPNNVIVQPLNYGDPNFKLKGVYGSQNNPDTTWFRVH